MSTLKVGAIRGVSASSDALTVANDGTCTANITNNLSNKNLIINGAMQVAQRGTSSTGDTYGSVDRFYKFHTGIDATVTSAQVAVASGTTPYTLGFRKAFKVTNGDQTSGAGAADGIEVLTKLESQDIANSGWNYLSTSSYITLSFWVKSSVAQNFYGQLLTKDGTQYNYPYETGSLTADTWTKITKTIPGNSNLQFDDDANLGLVLKFLLFRGTDYTDNSVSLNTWAADSSGTRSKDNTPTWYTTNGATWEITGVQLEVGSVATDFEHRSFAQELALCQRYFYAMMDGAKVLCENATMYNSSSPFWSVPFPVEMRAQPSLEVSNSTNHFLKYENNGGTNFDTFGRDGITSTRMGSMNGSVNGTAGNSVMIRGNNASSKVHWSAEL